jgi:hypothetical protein
VNAKLTPHPTVRRPDGRPRIAAPIWFAQAEPNLERRDVAREFLGVGTLSSVYGGSGCGKTFFTLDLCLAIARGIAWAGRHVMRGVVLYAAGEGYSSVLARLAAYRLHHFGEQRPMVPFALIPESINLLDPRAHVDAVAELAQQAQSEFELPTAMIVVDTLARAMAGGDENAPEVMGTAIKTADLLRARTGAHVCLIHHTGKAENGARGHSSLRAALDTEIEVTGIDGVRTATVRKQRDLPTGATVSFSLKPVVIGSNPLDGENVSSCVVEYTDAPASARRAPNGKRQSQLLRLLENEHAAGNAVWSDSEVRRLARERLGMHRNSAREALLGLHEAGYLRASVGGMTLVDQEAGDV